MDLAFLHPLYEHPGPWASVYADTSRHTEDTPHERSLTARAAATELAGQGADESTCEAVRAALEELRHSPEPHGRALFAAGEVVLDPPLAASPRGLSVHWSALPHTAPLLDLAGEDPLCVVAYVDRKGADFELRGARSSEDAGSVAGRLGVPPTPLRQWGSAQDRSGRAAEQAHSCSVLRNGSAASTKSPTTGGCSTDLSGRRPSAGETGGGVAVLFLRPERPTSA
jgi:hypothetical protein